MVTTSLQMEKGSYNRQQKKGRVTLTLLNLFFLYSIGNFLVKVVSMLVWFQFYFQ